MITLVNSETGQKVKCSGLWADHSGEEQVYGFESTVNHQAYDLEPCPLEFDGYDELPNVDDEDGEGQLATIHTVLPPWRVLIG